MGWDLPDKDIQLLDTHFRKYLEDRKSTSENILFIQHKESIQRS